MRKSWWFFIFQWLRNFTAFSEHFRTCVLNLNHSQRNCYHKVSLTFKNTYVLLLVLSTEAKGKKVSQNGKRSHPLSSLLSWHNNYAKSSNEKIQKVLLNVTLIKTY